MLAITLDGPGNLSYRLQVKVNVVCQLGDTFNDLHEVRGSGLAWRENVDDAGSSWDRMPFEEYERRNVFAWSTDIAIQEVWTLKLPYLVDIASLNPGERIKVHVRIKSQLQPLAPWQDELMVEIAVTDSMYLSEESASRTYLLEELDDEFDSGDGGWESNR